MRTNSPYDSLLRSTAQQSALPPRRVGLFALRSGSVSPLDVCYFVSPSKPLCERLVTLRRLVDIRTTLPVGQQPLRTSVKLHEQFFILSHRSSGLKIS